jgi:hydrogenase/urease accessory protein HupE
MLEPRPFGCRIGLLAWPAFALAAWLSPTPAEAHTPVQGIGGFWSGVVHLLTSLDQVGFLIGLAILTSFADRRFDARVIGAALVAVFAGVFVGDRLPATEIIDFAGAGAAMMLTVGLLGAAHLRIGAAPLLGLASVGGLVGGVSGAEASAGLSLGLFSLGGSIAGASVLSYGLLATRRLDAEWGVIARRVGASWIAAIGLMILALFCARRFGRL